MPAQYTPLPPMVINFANLEVTPTQEYGPGPFHFWLFFEDPRTRLRLVVCDNHSGSSKTACHKLADGLEPAGIYLLIGPSACYVGQSKDLNQRLTDHSRTNKENFFRLIAIHRTDLRTDLDYLESAAYNKLVELGVPLAQQDLRSKYQREQQNLSTRDSVAYHKLTEVAQNFVAYCLAFGLNPSSYSKQPSLRTRGRCSPYDHQPLSFSDCNFTPLFLTATPQVPSTTQVPSLLPLTSQTNLDALCLPAVAAPLTAGLTTASATNALPPALQPVRLRCKIPRTNEYGEAMYYPDIERIRLLKGSVAIAQPQPSGTDARNSTENKLKWLPHPQNHKLLILQEDSNNFAPSTAATIIRGSQISGYIAWETLQGKNLRDVMSLSTQAHAAQLKTATPGP